MPDEAAVRASLVDALGAGAAAVDGEVLDYVASCLADDDMEWGVDGAGAYDAVGEMLCDAAGGEDATKALCARLATALCIGGAAASAPAAVAAEPAARRTPVVMGGLTKEEAGGSLGKLARGVITACTDGQEMDEAKATKRRTREEVKAREAYEKHLAELAAAAAGDKATVVRNAGAGGSRDITLENLVISNGGEVLVEDGSLTLAHGRRYGLIGRNGTGKSTLLRAIANRGVAGLSAATQVLHVEQEVTGDDTSVLESVLSADGERVALLAEEAKLLADASGAGSDRLSAVYARLLEIDAYTAEARAAAILAGLSFPPDAQQRPTKSFSGGWRMRVALARALFVVPDLLLLDEARRACRHACALTRQLCLCVRALLTYAFCAPAHCHRSRFGCLHPPPRSRRTTWTCRQSSGWRRRCRRGRRRCCWCRTRATF
jgi:ATP-binding cassette subfamily F protein 3